MHYYPNYYSRPLEPTARRAQQPRRAPCPRFARALLGSRRCRRRGLMHSVSEGAAASECPTPFSRMQACRDGLTLLDGLGWWRSLLQSGLARAQGTRAGVRRERTVQRKGGGRGENDVEGGGREGTWWTEFIGARQLVCTSRRANKLD